MRKPAQSGVHKVPDWRWGFRVSWSGAHERAQNNGQSTSAYGARLSLLPSRPLLQLLLLLSVHNLEAFASDTSTHSATNSTIGSGTKSHLTKTNDRTAPLEDLKEVEERAGGQLATPVPPMNSSASDEDAVISASEILADPVVLGSNRSGRFLERVVFGTQHDEAVTSATTPAVHGGELLFVAKSTEPPIIQPQLNFNNFDSINQQTSRLMLQMFLVGLMIFITLTLCIVYGIKFCLCRRRKAVRMLMRRALVGDLAASQQAIGTISRPADNFLLTECPCHHQYNARLASDHHDDCIDGYQYFSGVAQGVEPASPIQNRNSMILTLIQRLQQTLMVASTGDASHVAGAAQPVSSNQQQLAELIVAQLQAQLIASGCLQNTCPYQHHQLMGQVPVGPAQRPPAYHELFTQQHQHQRQVSPSAPSQQVATRGADTTCSRSTISDQEECAERGRQS